MTPRVLLLGLVLLGVICVLAGIVQLVRAVIHLLRRNAVGALAPLLTKIEHTSNVLETTLARVDTLDALVLRAQRALALIAAAREGSQVAGAAMARAAQNVRDEWSRLRSSV